MDFLALPRGKHVELEHEEHDADDEHDADADAESYEFEFPWEPLDPMSPEDIAAAPRSCVGHLELHGCGLVHGALAPERCAALRGFVDAELQRLLQELERLEQDEDQAGLGVLFSLVPFLFFNLFFPIFSRFASDGTPCVGSKMLVRRGTWSGSSSARCGTGSIAGT